MSVDLDEYRAFIAAKAGDQCRYGFDPKPIPDVMKHHQKVAVDYALNKGRYQNDSR